ncbi:hypothetical protein ApDm4_1233 [Acetobacter pomorum]|nr:hypothetical protein ApDm4_1233 [Acetobacter pomorum]
MIGRFIINFCTFIAIKWIFYRQKRQSAADYHYLLVFGTTGFVPGFFTSNKSAMHDIQLLICN